jgi:Cd2+/Zn2+-exporting ATPase
MDLEKNFDTKAVKYITNGLSCANKNTVIKVILSFSLFIIVNLIKFPIAVEICIYIIAYLIAGGNVLLKALKNIIKGQVFDENFLMALATIGALAIQKFPEAVAVMLFYKTGELFESIAVTNSKKSISSLMEIRPDYANKIIDGKLQTVSPELVFPGDVIVIMPGERVPLDGVVITGSSYMDTSAITGESVPREVTGNDTVLSGFINKGGVIELEVTKTFGESTVSRILDLVQNASNKKAPTEKFITKFSRYYTPAVVITALMLAFLTPIFTHTSFIQWIYRALIFLVVSCPCALVISIPLGFFAGIGGASKKGVLIKGSNYLEALNEIDTVVFDKTGTLTKGTFTVRDIKPSDEFTEAEILEYAANAEIYSSHPIALSILNAYKGSIKREYITNYEEVMGNGIKCFVRAKEVYIGNSTFFSNNGISVPENDNHTTIVYVAINKKYAGYISISDVVKHDAVSTISVLKSMGIKRVIMLTGDNQKTAEAVGDMLGVDIVYSNLLPDQKVQILEQLEADNVTSGKLAFVGDGINDAPILARADIGIAMGGLGSDAAIESADIILMTDEPSKLITALKLARKTHKVIWQNIVFALGIKAVILILSAFGLSEMWEAVFADVGVAILAILNSMRAMRI